jgi:hypothetical protein
MAENMEPKVTTLAEVNDLIAWKSEEPDGETIYHLEMNLVTLHFFQEEWDEFLQLAKQLAGHGK